MRWIIKIGLLKVATKSATAKFTIRYFVRLDFFFPLMISLVKWKITNKLPAVLKNEYDAIDNSDCDLSFQSKNHFYKLVKSNQLAVGELCNFSSYSTFSYV